MNLLKHISICFSFVFFLSSSLIASDSIQEAPTIVFDIDHVLCVKLDNSVLNEPILKFPALQPIPFYDNEKSHPHFFFPNFDALFLILIQWGWHIDFFSYGVKERNERVLSAYLNLVIPDEYKRLSEEGEFRIFSRDDIENCGPFLSQSYAHEYVAESKKNLSVLKKDINNCVLVDDDITLIKGEQYPFIHLEPLPAQALSKKINRTIQKRRGNYYEQKGDLLVAQQIINYAPYILGILYECKALMEEREGTNIREALSQVLLKPEEVEKICSVWGRNLVMPWLIGVKIKDNPYANRWIFVGNQLISKIKKHDNHMNPFEEYKKIEKDLYHKD